MAFNEQLRLDSQVEVAGLQQDHATIQHLLVVAEQAAERAAEIRRRILAHETRMHPLTPPA